MVLETVELSPGTERLAVALSVAARIEPQLIRAVRLEILPGLDVGHESELWFSGWVARGPESISLRNDLLPGLRDLLTVLLANAEPDDPILRLGDIVADLHTGLPAALRIEEEINWLSVVRTPGCREAMDESLESALRAIVDDGRDGIADWYAGAVERLPAEARATKAAWLLAAVAGRRYPHLLPSAGQAPEELATHDLARIGGVLDGAVLGLAWDGDYLVIAGDGQGGQVGIPVPDTSPRLVDVIVGNETTTHRIAVDGRTRVAVPNGQVRLRTAFGTVFDISGSAYFSFVKELADELGEDGFRRVREALPATEILDEMLHVVALRRARTGGEGIFLRADFEVSLSPAAYIQLEPFLAAVGKELGVAFRATGRQEGWMLAEAPVRVAFAQDVSLRSGQFRVVIGAGSDGWTVPEPPRTRPASDEVADWFQGELDGWFQREPALAERLQGAIPPVNILKLLLWEAEQHRVIVAGETVHVTLPGSYRVRMAGVDADRFAWDERELCFLLGRAVDRFIMLRGWGVAGDTTPSADGKRIELSSVRVRFEAASVPVGRFEVVVETTPEPPASVDARGHVPRDFVNSYPNWWLEAADGSVHRLAPGRSVLGNSPDADVSLADPWISARHAEIFCTDIDVRIHRLSTANGILINGQAVDDHPLRDGDEIGLGATTLTFGERRAATGDDPPAARTMGFAKVTPSPPAAVPPSSPVTSHAGNRFRRRALRRGYKVEEVDKFIDQVEATLAGTAGEAEAVNADDVKYVVFRIRFGGYDEWQVDLHLDTVERQLRGMPGQGPR
jgi:DivIVA domain-containing protein